MDDGLIGIQEMAVRAVCGRLTAVQLQEMQRSVEQACLIPKHIGWDRKASAHAELFTLLADSAGDPVLAQVLNLGAGIAHHLMVTAGPSAAGITANSCKRILACLSTGDSDGAAHEVEGYLRVLKNGRTTSEHKHYGGGAHRGAQDERGRHLLPQRARVQLHDLGALMTFEPDYEGDNQNCAWVRERVRRKFPTYAAVTDDLVVAAIAETLILSGSTR
jgi:FCD domain-containing protein